VPTALAVMPHQPTEVPLAPADAQSAHTRTPNAVETNVEPATDKLVSALARTDGPEVPALDVTDKSELPHTTQDLKPVDTALEILLLPDTVQPETTNAQSAHTRDPNVVELNVVIATELLEPACARTDGLEVPVPDVTENRQTSPTEAKSLNAQCAHTRKPNAVELNVVIVTELLVNANVKANGTEALAPTKEKLLVLDTLALMLVTRTLLTEPLLTPWDPSGLPSSVSSPPFASSLPLS